MPYTQIALVLPLLLAAIIGGAFVWYALRKRRVAFGGLLIVLAIMVLAWQVLYLLELLIADFNTKRDLLNLQYFVIPYIAPLFLLFVLGFTGMRRPSVPLAFMLFAIPFFSSVACWTNAWHGLFYRTLGLRSFGSLSALTLERGACFYVLEVYSLCVAAFAALRLIMAYRRLNRLYAKQMFILISGIILPVMGNLAHTVFGATLDFTPLLLVASVYLVAWLIFDYSFCDTLPKPREAYLESLDSAVFQLNTDNLVLDMNAAACALLKKRPADIFFQDIASLFKSIGVKPEFKEDEEFRLSKGALDSYYAMHLCKTDNYSLLQVSDVSARKRMEERSNYFANFDSLTALPNRNLFFKLLQRELDNVKRFGYALVLMIIDLDGFHDINEMYGYAVGDRVIVELSKRLSDRLRKIDTVARFDDGFHAILPRISNLELDMPVIMERVLSAFASPVVFGGNTIEFTVSIGVAIAPDDGAETDELLSSAQTALNSRQARDRNTYCLYSPELERNLEQNVDSEQSIKRALETGDVEYTFDAVRDGFGKAAYVQASVRMKHGLGAPIFPNTAIGSRAPDIDLFIVHSLCAKIRAHGSDGTPLIIPLAYWQLLNEEFIASLCKSLRQFAIERGELLFLVQAAALRQQNKRAQESLKALLAAGADFMLDGFEANLAIAELLLANKLTRVRLSDSLVAHIDEAACALMAQSAKSLADSMGLELHAAKVDSSEQLELLRQIGITLTAGETVLDSMSTG